ncbi:hypothetical protein DRW07_06735 [Alteromonas sediminis]|uniref:Solute-binding protein family 3/N-terminal domain-containing protein n=1 Tax=Alteromonas sediminis TaxID=2259342 RepID=A0A3N5Z8M0_9ALTE|nr:transporter substrate-binding domain-containing protein [Alteromonas sediminis]RPJ67224.1 hypothetical protein DRW07_06735 [Alteromonas sediminis]
MPVFPSILVALLYSLLSLAAQADEFIIGINERPIYREKDADGFWHGKDIDLVKAIFSKTEHTYTLIAMPWTRVLKSLQSGEIDMTLAAAITPERQQYAYFSHKPYRYSDYTLFANKTRLELFGLVSSLEDLKNKPVLIGALRGAIYSSSYKELMSDPLFAEHIVYIDNDYSMVEFALKGRVDGYIDSNVESKQYFKQHPQHTDTFVPLLKISTKGEQGSYLMFSKKSVPSQRVGIFDSVLTELHDSGEYERIASQYN